MTYLFREDTGDGVTKRHLGPAGDAIISHLDIDDGVERRLHGSHGDS